MTYASFIKCKYKYSFIKTFNMLKKSIIYHFFFSIQSAPADMKSMKYMN